MVMRPLTTRSVVIRWRYSATSIMTTSNNTTNWRLLRRVPFLPGLPTLAIPPHSSLNGVAPPNTPRFAGQPEGSGVGEDQTPTPVDAFNPFNPFNQIISGGTRARIFDFGNRLEDTENEAWLSTVGVKGDKVFGSNWGYDGGFRYSQIYNIFQIQTASVSRMNRIMNANDSIFKPNSSDFIGTTIPYNPFTISRSRLLRAIFPRSCLLVQRSNN